MKPRIKGKWFFNPVWGWELKWTCDNKYWFHDPLAAIDFAQFRACPL